MKLDKLKQEVFEAVDRFERKSELVVKNIVAKHDNTLEMDGNTAVTVKVLKKIEIEVEII
jgi:hypothetical protein